MIFEWDGSLGIWERGFGIQVWLGKHGVTESAWPAKVFGVRMQHGISMGHGAFKEGHRHRLQVLDYRLHLIAQ